MTSSEDDFDVLERVFLRVGSADTDEQLESAINKFLIPVIIKLSSTDEEARNKIMELLSHINRRIRRTPTVQLPVETLLMHYKDPDASTFLVNFSILYIKLGFSRLPLQKKMELVPLLLSASGRKHKTHQDSLLFLLTSMVDHLKAVAESENHREFFKMDENPELMKNLCNFMLDVILLPYTRPSPSTSDDLALSGSQFFETPPGMSAYGYKRVTAGEPPMTGETLEEIKVGILKFLATGIMPAEDVVCHFIIGSSDPRFMVADYADNELRRISCCVNWANTALASRLFHIYLGTPGGPPDKKHPIPAAHRVMPGSTRIRLKILPFLSKLEKNAILFPLNIQVVFDTLHSDTSNLRLRIHALNFALATVKRVDDSIFRKMGGMLYTGLLKLVLNDEESIQLRVVGYTVLGQIVKRMPCIINKNLTDLQIFFGNLNHEHNDIRTAVRDALVVMIDSFRLFLRNVEVGMDNIGNNVEKMDLDSKDNSEELERINKELSNRELMMLEFLAFQVESNVPMARLVATKYLSAVFDTDHAPSRYLLLLAVGDPDLEVSSFAMKALYTDVEWGEYKDKLIPIPDFLKMVECVHEQAKIRIQNVNQRVTIQNIVSPFSEVVFNEILTFLRLCMAQSSSVELTSKEDMFIHPCEHSPSIRRYILEVHAKNPTVFDYYLKMIEMLLVPYVSEVPITCLAEIIGTCPELFTDRFAPRFQQFMSLLSHAVDDVKDNVAFILSVLAVLTMDEEKLNETTKILMKKLGDKSAEIQKGAIFALGYLFHERIAQLTRNGVQYNPKSHPLDKEIFLKIVKNLEDPDSVLISATCTALSQIMKSAPIPLPDNSRSGLSKYSVMKKLLDIANSGRLGSKIKERAILACGMMCIGDKFPFPKQLIQKLVDISKQTKEIETHLCIAESLILCLEGTSSPEKRDVWKIRESDYGRPPIPEENLYLLNTLVDELVSQVTIPHQNFRQAISVFLLSILKKFCFLENVKIRFPAFQSAFLELLSENELVQDIASKGLAFVYEVTSPEKKKELVAKLVNQMLSGRRTVQQVSRDSRLFDEGQVVANSSGGNLSTYRELCSLASELNHPDLIYKFMHLVNQNVAWNSRKGAAFGFHTIALYAKDELDEYLPQIIPRLYRYQFDPTPKIQNAMCSIWRSLVKDVNKALKMYFHEILEDLATNVISDQWRVRISCALALTNFIRSDRNILDGIDKLPNLMNSLFRVMDDVHEATRLAAQSAAKNIAKHCVTACDPKHASAEKNLQIILSIFLPGITSNVAEVRNVCLHTISQLVSAAGSTLKPSLPTLIGALLEAAGELESVGLSYLSAQLSGRANKQEIIDNVRANMTKTHFTTLTVTKCVQYMEPKMLEIVVPKTLEIIKDVNLGSRVAAAHFIVLLTHEMGKAMEAYIGKILATLLNGLLDRNTTVRRTYAYTLGQILQIAKPTSLEKLFKKLSIWYFEKEDVNTRTTIAVCLQSSIRHNGELLKNYFPTLIPLIFFAMHEKKTEGEDNSHVIMWEEIWNDISLGYESTIKLQFDGILSCLDEALISLSWTTKAQAGRCIQTIAVKLGEGIDTERRDRLIAMSLKALEGKTFTGKEDIVNAVAKLCTHAGPDLKEAPVCQSIVDALLRESRKPQIAYRRHSFEALGRVLETFDNMDHFQRVYELSRSIIGKFKEQHEEDISENINSRRKEMFSTLNVIYVCLGKSWPRKKETQLQYQDVLLNECCDSLEHSPRDVQVSILIALHYYIDKLHYFSPEYTLTEEAESSVRDILQKLTIVLHYSLGIPKNVTIRKEALNMMATILKKLVLTGRDQELGLLAEFLRDRINELEKDDSPEVKTRLTHVKEILRR